MIDLVHVATQIAENCCEHSMEIHVLFVEFKQAFDSARRIGVSKKLLRLAQSRDRKRNSIPIISNSIGIKSG